MVPGGTSDVDVGMSGEEEIAVQKGGERTGLILELARRGGYPDFAREKKDNCCRTHNCCRYSKRSASLDGIDWVATRHPPTPRPRRPPLLSQATFFSGAEW